MGVDMKEVLEGRRKLPVEEELFWKSIGIWLGLGRIRKNRVEWVVEESHQDSFIGTVDSFGELLEKEVKTFVKGKNTVQAIKHKELAKFLEESFLRDVREIPVYLYRLDIRLVQNFVKGYWLVMGELYDNGKDYLDKECERYIYFNTIEVGVLQGLRDMLASHDIISILQEEEDNTYTLKFTGRNTNKLNRFILG